MLVSVIIPVFNGELYLAQAIESVLAQTYTNWEIIVVDDGSTDGSAEITRRFGDHLKLVQQAQAGTGPARNTGIALAQGEAIALLDADDLWLPNKLELQTTFLAEHPEIDIVYGQMQQFYSEELNETERIHTPCGEEWVAGAVPGTVLVRTASFHRVGPFDPLHDEAEYMDWSLRAAEKGLKAHILPHPLARRRLHRTNKSLNPNNQIARIPILKAALDRRRAAANAAPVNTATPPPDTSNQESPE